MRPLEALNRYRELLLSQVSALPEASSFFSLMGSGFAVVGNESAATSPRTAMLSGLEEPISAEMASALERLSDADKVTIAEALVPLVEYYGMESSAGVERSSARDAARRGRRATRRTSRGGARKHKTTRKFRKQYGGITLSEILTMGFSLVGGVFATQAATEAGQMPPINLAHELPAEPAMNGGMTLLIAGVAVIVTGTAAVAARIYADHDLGFNDAIRAHTRAVRRRVNEFLGNRPERPLGVEMELVGALVDRLIHGRRDPVMREQAHLEDFMAEMEEDREREAERRRGWRQVVVHPAGANPNFGNIGDPGNNGNAAMAAYTEYQAQSRRAGRTAAQRAASAMARAAPTNARAIVSERNNQGDVCVICQSALSADSGPIVAVETTERRAAGTRRDPVACGHKYHSECIQGIFDLANHEGKDPKCPTCRGVVIRLRRAHPEA